MHGAKREFFKAGFVQRFLLKINPEKGRPVFVAEAHLPLLGRNALFLLPFLGHQGKKSIEANKVSGPKTWGGLGRKRRETRTVEL